MFNFDNSFLRSTVSRRVVLFFLITAVIPIATITLIAYNQIKGQLQEETRRQVYRESRALGLNLYDRMLSLETNLNIIAKEIDRGADPNQFMNDPSLEAVFSGMAIYTGMNLSTRISGADWPQSMDSYSFSLNKVNDDNSLLTLHPNGAGTDLIMLKAVSTEDAGKYLLAKINQESFWDLGIHTPDILCFITPSGDILNCSSDIQDHYLKHLTSRIQNLSGTNYQEAYIEGQHYALNAWNLFLKAKYDMESILVVLAVPERAVYFALNNFKAIFPQTLIVCGLLIALISMFQIRKSLDPLKKLTAGIKRVTAGNYSVPVEITSGDEFEDLGKSFNRMSQKIEQQVSSITFFSEIDRLILSSLDTDYIFKTLFEYVHGILNASYISVVTKIDEDTLTGTACFNLDSEFNDLETIELHMNNKDLVELEFNSDHMFTRESKSYTDYLPVHTRLHYLIFPIWSKGHLSGIMLLAREQEFQVDDDILIELREIADRVAVAMSNAVSEEKLYTQAHYDALTELPNRYLFNDRLNQTIERAKRQNFKIAILFIDLDRFKNINDSMGHLAGDEALVKVAELLSGTVRAYDTLARLSGDEFIIMITDEDNAEPIEVRGDRLVNRILSAMKEPIQVKDKEVYVTPSIGIAIYPDDTDEIVDLLRFADVAMYKAKEDKLTNYQFYDKLFDNFSVERIDLENELRVAIASNQFELEFQPKINLKTNELIGAEALIRWNHPEKGRLEPEQFIQIAEYTGEIINLGYWVMREACKYSQKWSAGKHNVNISLNISVQQFRSTGLLNNLKQIIEESGANPELLEVEITESMTIENYRQSIIVLNELDAMGIQISIDDFGTGYSSLSYLQQLPITRIKIDKTFLEKLPTDDNSKNIVRSIITLAHSMDLLVIGEGVETEEQMQILREYGCDEAQGFLISKSLPVLEFEQKWLGK